MTNATQTQTQPATNELTTQEWNDAVRHNRYSKALRKATTPEEVSIIMSPLCAEEGLNSGILFSDIAEMGGSLGLLGSVANNMWMILSIG